jgi:hypothetical protein
MATPSFAASAGVTPDFLWDPAVSGTLAASCGLVCWGAPGTAAEDPPTWDATSPHCYTTCIAYGGATLTAATCPTGNTTWDITETTALDPGNGTQSLARNDAGFVLATPTPANNGCASMTTTTTTPDTSSTTLPETGAPTTTTRPGEAGQHLAGTRLLLKTPSNPAKRALGLLARDSAITLGDGNGSADDPTADAGGSLRVVSGAGFDDTYLLPGVSWKTLGEAGANKGYRFASSGPIRNVRVKRGKLIKIVAKGAALGHSLAGNPAPVDVVLTIGTERYCMRFGGTVTFAPGKRFLATDALAPGSCPP